MPAVPLDPWRPSMDAWHRAIELGALEDERVELLDGAVVGLNAPDPAHENVAALLLEIVQAAVHDQPRLELRVNSPLTLADGWEPLPDLYVHDPGAPRLYHPSRALWVCEIANSSAGKDRLVKGPAYARADVPEFWLVDLAARRVEIHTDPTTMQGYATVAAETDGRRRITALPAATVDLDALWRAAFPA